MFHPDISNHPLGPPLHLYSEEVEPSSTINLKIRSEASKISKLDVSAMEHPLKRFLIKANKFLNFINLVGGVFNAHTIMTGASKKWSATRLKKGKHVLLKKIGGEHVSLISKTLCKVDGHFFNAANFMQKLEKLGGKRSWLKLEVEDSSIFKGKKCYLEVDEDFPVEMQEIYLSAEQQTQDKYGHFKILDYISSFTDQMVEIIQDDKSGKFYLIDKASCNRLRQNKVVNLKNRFDNTVKETDQTVSILSENMEFPIIKFDKNASQWQEVIKLLNELKINKTSWDFVEKNDAIYLIPVKHSQKLNAGLEKKGCSLKEKPAIASTTSIERGTVLLTMNQSDIYEQYSHEVLNFMFEGLNVMAYNNPGKGLSTGLAYTKNINASIEASYQYLKILGITDEKILAKGQCFGGAPTAWLSAQHPNINVMLDQNPANFHDVAMRKVNYFAKNLMIENRPSFFQWIGKVLKNNFIIHGIAKFILGGYDVPTDLAHNNGHKLLNVNPPNAKGVGGDCLVPTHHPELMIDAMLDNPSKIISLSMNPGASHVTDWWAGEESQETVIQFLARTGLSQPLF